MPDGIRLLASNPVVAIVSKTYVEVIYDLCENEAHFCIGEARSDIVSRAVEEEQD